jgi:homoprotocatechuate degradation regulator HpaR
MRSARVRIKHRNLPLLLLQAREQVISRFRPILNANNITEQQWRIVRVLLEMGSLEPREIGRLCAISSPSLAGILSRMEELGLIARERFEQDYRRLRVSLIGRGRALAVQIAPQIEATYRRIEERLGVEFCQKLYQDLDRVVTTLGLSHQSEPCASSYRRR